MMTDMSQDLCECLKYKKFYGPKMYKISSQKTGDVFAYNNLTYSTTRTKIDGYEAFQSGCSSWVRFYNNCNRMSKAIVLPLQPATITMNPQIEECARYRPFPDRSRPKESLIRPLQIENIPEQNQAGWTVLVWCAQIAFKIG